MEANTYENSNLVHSENVTEIIINVRVIEESNLNFFSLFLYVSIIFIIIFGYLFWLNKGTNKIIVVKASAVVNSCATLKTNEEFCSILARIIVNIAPHPK